MMSIHPGYPADLPAASGAAIEGLPDPFPRRWLWASAAVLGMLGGCASTPPPPTLALQAAEQAIAAADRSRDADTPSPELNEARSRLGAARAAVAQQRMVDAERLANESRADAELASARIQTAADMALNEELRHGNATLAQELQHQQGGPQ